MSAINVTFLMRLALAVAVLGFFTLAASFAVAVFAALRLLGVL